MGSVLDAFISRADLADLALLMWAVGVTGLLMASLRQLGAANRRFDLFVQELARFNRRYDGVRDVNRPRIGASGDADADFTS